MAIRGVLLDIAGVLYDGETPIPGAIEAVERLRAAGLPPRLITNTSRQPKTGVPSIPFFRYFFVAIYTNICNFVLRVTR